MYVCKLNKASGPLAHLSKKKLRGPLNYFVFSTDLIQIKYLLLINYI